MADSRELMKYVRNQIRKMNKNINHDWSTSLDIDGVPYLAPLVGSVKIEIVNWSRNTSEVCIRVYNPRRMANVYDSRYCYYEWFPLYEKSMRFISWKIWRAANELAIDERRALGI